MILCFVSGFLGDLLEFTLSVDLVLMLFSIAVIAGFVDSIAGGGGLIAMPALLAAGLSPLQALATNKLQGTGGTLSASYYFIRKGAVKLSEMRLAIVMTFLGSALGTILVQQLDLSVLSQIIPFLLIGIVLYFLFSPKISDENRHEKIGLPLFSCTAAMIIGFYDGFFGPGTGSFFAIAFVSLMGYSITRATAHTKLLNCTSNIASLLFFIVGGQVVWTVGLVMMAGQVIGARLGSGFVLKNGQKLIRPMIVIVSLAMTAKLLWNNYAPLLVG